jgi:hypothetical protein
MSPVISPSVGFETFQEIRSAIKSKKAVVAEKKVKKFAVPKLREPERKILQINNLQIEEPPNPIMDEFRQRDGEEIIRNPYEYALGQRINDEVQDAVAAMRNIPPNFIEGWARNRVLIDDVVDFGEVAQQNLDNMERAPIEWAPIEPRRR